MALILPGDPAFHAGPEHDQPEPDHRCGITRKETDAQCRNVGTVLGQFVCVKCLTGWPAMPMCERCYRKARQQTGTCECGGEVMLTAKALPR